MRRHQLHDGKLGKYPQAAGDSFTCSSNTSSSLVITLILVVIRHLSSSMVSRPRPLELDGLMGAVHGVALGLRV